MFSTGQKGFLIKLWNWLIHTQAELCTPLALRYLQTSNFSIFRLMSFVSMWVVGLPTYHMLPASTYNICNLHMTCQVEECVREEYQLDFHVSNPVDLYRTRSDTEKFMESHVPYVLCTDLVLSIWLLRRHSVVIRQ